MCPKNLVKWIELLINFIIRYGKAKGLVKTDLKPEDIIVDIKFPHVLPANATKEKEFAVDAFDKGVYDLETTLTEIKRVGADIDVQAVMDRVKSQEKLFQASLEPVLNTQPDTTQGEKIQSENNL